MKGLTNKEEEIMNFFWEKDSLFVKDILELYPEPKPHVNTVSTMVRILEEKGFLGHESFGKTYRYFSLIQKEEYSQGTLKGVIRKYFDNSYLGAVSSLISEEKISVQDLQDLIKQVEEANKK